MGAAKLGELRAETRRTLEQRRHEELRTAVQAAIAKLVPTPVPGKGNAIPNADYEALLTARCLIRDVRDDLRNALAIDDITARYPPR